MMLHFKDLKDNDRRKGERLQTSLGFDYNGFSGCDLEPYKLKLIVWIFCF